MPKENLYDRAGIRDVAEFYRNKFVSDEVLNARYVNALDRFDIRFARTMWVYENVRAGSHVLDLGCGAGMLALLKRKGITLTGVDLSRECALAALHNGYDETFSAELSSLPFADASFDYVVSLDVLGHVLAAEKDAVLAEVKRVLRPGGVTLHGIECTDRSAQRSYDEMSAEELRRFIEVDGHVGLEEEQEHAGRFRKFFSHVAWEPRYALCLSSEVFLKASDAPLGPFYNEHRDRRALFSTARDHADEKLVCLDRRSDVTFDDGWYEPNMLPPVARWMGRRARVNFSAAKLSEIRLDITTHMPGLSARPLELELLLNGEKVCALSLWRYGWIELRVPVLGTLSEPANSEFELEIRAGRTWQPRPVAAETRDDRELSVAVCNITVKSEK